MKVLFRKTHFLLAVALVFTSSCNHEQKDTEHHKKEVSENWKTQFNQTLPLLGHRNWIVVADKAFPKQNAAGNPLIKFLQGKVL